MGAGTMKLESAQQIAEALIRNLEPYTERIEIGGSVRRKKSEVKDIELICIPKFEDVTTGQYTLWEEPITARTNSLFSHLAKTVGYSVEKMGERYCKFEYQRGGWKPIKVDVFTATPETWGYIPMIRTGSAEFSKWVVTELKRRGCTPKDGAVWVNDIPSGQIRADIASENAMFHLLGIDWIEPEDRGVIK